MSRSREGVDLEGKTILIAEDEMLVAMELESMLEALGCTILGPAKSAKRALALLDREGADAALLDLNLLGSYDASLAKRLLERGIPFAVVTGYSAEALKAPELRNAPYVNKPATRATIQRALERALGGGAQ